MSFLNTHWPLLLAAGSVLILFSACVVAWANRDMEASDPPDENQEPRRPARKALKPSYDGRAQSNVLSLNVRRDELAQIDVQAASHALIDMGRGEKRSNPYQDGPHDKFMRYQLRYMETWMDRDHAIADSQAVTRF